MPSHGAPGGPEHAHHHAHAEPSRMPMWVAIALTIVSGGFVALQSRVNGELSRELDDFAVAAAISFGSGLVILSLLAVLWPAGRRGLARLRTAVRARRLAWWMLLGGVAGAWFVATQGLAAGVLGVALFTVAIVAGQTLGGVVFDAIGLGPGGRRPLSPTRIAGAVLALVAIGWAVSAQVAEAVPLWLMLLPFSAGVGASWQQAMNGRVRTASASALAATFTNFLVGTIVLVVVMLVHAASVGWPNSFPTAPWLYAGGAIGCVFIAAQAVLVRRVGVLVLALGLVAGQLAVALALDLLLPTSARPVGFATVGGTVLALVAVALASIRWRPARHLAAEVPAMPGAQPGDVSRAP
ncbi:DMT family transporter [Agromyces bracchium]|uniref:DMT family transporter n=1 Tax=Agromyces bracchium TaxID=88376 RepID=UPI0018ACEA8F|nr:DMT family transporter [Agromyces bracchium]